MAVFCDLLAKLPKSTETRMSTQGYVLWFSWQNDLDPVINQTLQNYGGMFIESDFEQSAWFFFNKDVFLALARLSVWARFNPLTASVQLLRGRLQFGLRQEISISLESKLEEQEMFPGKSFEIEIHSKSMEGDTNFPGITFIKSPLKQGMAIAEWFTIDADTRLPYTSSLGWYGIWRPLGNPLDPAFQKAWPHMQQLLINTLKSHKLKFILQDDFIMFSIDNLLLMRAWLREALGRVDEVKNSKPEHFWPFLTVIIDRKGMNFNGDLYKKVGLQWSRLSPDNPYMSYRTAYLLGEGFEVRDIRFSNNHTSMDAWCIVALGEIAAGTPAIPVIMAGQLISDDPPCFFCGINTHKVQDCPTLRMSSEACEASGKAASMDLDAINNAFRAIENSANDDGEIPYESIFSKGDERAELLKAIFEINFYSQVRSMPFMWITKGAGIGKVRDQLDLQRDEHVVWDIFDKFDKISGGPLGGLIPELLELITRNPREMRLRNLLGFMYVYMGDYTKAHTAFKEAATLTGVPALQAWNEYLQARMAEVQEQYLDAIAQYGQIQRVMPQWKSIDYRRIVCKVKMGFVEQELTGIGKLVQDDMYYFNRFLLDPELGRGRLMILTYLYPIWKDAEQRADVEAKKTSLLNEKVGLWFPPTHPNYMMMQNLIQDLVQIANTKNYITFLEVIKQRPILEKKIDEVIQRQVEDLQARYKFYLAELQKVRDEAAWFPFPKLLKDFSDEFNQAASVLNWAFSSNFQEAENFQRAQSTMKEVEDLLRGLKRRLKTLRALRDGTLFGMTFIKTFIWIEGIGLLLSFITVPAIVLFGHEIGLGWLRDVLATQQWQIQKVLVGIITVVSFGLAMLRSTVTFERQRDKFLDQAKEQRERMQEERLNKIRKKRQAEAEYNAKRRKELQERELRRKLEESR